MCPVLSCRWGFGKEQYQCQLLLVKIRPWCPGPGCLREISGERLEFEDSESLD